ncbi:MAG: glycosyltransferase family 2 protein [Allomuricauda sp.]
MNKSLYILIPVYNALYYTKKCIENLEIALNHYNLSVNPSMKVTVVVIDDGSTDGTAQWIKKNYPHVVTLKGDGNLFWSAAINMGVSYALDEQCSHILLWSKDLYIEKDYFLNLDKTISQGKKKTVFASKLYRKNTPDILFSFGGSYNPRTDKKINIGAGHTDGVDYQKAMKIDWCGGMAVAMPSSFFLEVGYCDDQNFPQYDGDTDLFLRAKTQGYQLYVFPELKVWNIHENTGKKEKYSFKNFLWYLKDIRSFKNLKISYKFLKKHSIGAMPYFFFIGRYLSFSTRYFAKMIIYSFK